MHSACVSGLWILGCRNRQNEKLRRWGFFFKRKLEFVFDLLAVDREGNVRVADGEI